MQNLIPKFMRSHEATLSTSKYNLVNKKNKSYKTEKAIR